MGLQDAPNAARVQIGFFGLRNVGKSSLLNAVTGQDAAVVSDVGGTTTDPVVKAMELLPAGPVSIIDTPGIDDAGDLGELRVERALRVMRRCDVCVLVVPAGRAFHPAERDLIAAFAQRGVPYAVALTKADLLEVGEHGEGADAPGGEGAAAALADVALGTFDPVSAPAATVLVSAKTGRGIFDLKEVLASLARTAAPAKRLLADLIEPGDAVVLVAPIDSSAPAGRIILPQQMAIRDILDAHACATVCQPDQLEGVLGALICPPKLVVADSQALDHVARIVPAHVPLTTFSVLMARFKGDLAPLVRGARALARLTDASRVLISEGCTHHRQCDDIGTVKLPAWIRAHAQASPAFDFTSGGEFPENLEGYDAVVHCGGCMLNAREMRFRLDAAQRAGVPMVNYGVAIACMQGHLERVLAPLGGAGALA